MRIEEHKQKLIRYYLEGRMEILGLDAEVSDRDFQRFCRQTKIMEIVSINIFLLLVLHDEMSTF